MSGTPFTVERISAALAALDAVAPGTREPTPADEEQPVFVLAACWRSGSTLLQRVFNTDPQILLWGEPLGRMSFIARLMEGLCAAAPEDWPFPRMWITHEPDRDLATSWTGNLFPPAPDLRAALQDFVLRWLAAPARARGYQRWGLKETRFGASEAVFLRWLFPRATIIALLRDPRDAWLSQRSRRGGGGVAWARWPDGGVEGPAAFARHWNRLASSWQSLPPDFGHLVVRYEDLISGKVDFRALEARCGLALDEKLALERKVGNAEGKAPPAVPLSEEEQRLILAEAEPGLRAFGYL